MTESTAIVVLVAGTLVASVAALLSRCKRCRGPSGCQLDFTTPDGQNAGVHDQPRLTRTQSILRKVRRAFSNDSREADVQPVADHPAPPHAGHNTVSIV